MEDKQITMLKKIAKLGYDNKDIISMLKNYYKQVSNQNNKKYAKTYDLGTILTNKTLATIKRKFGKITVVLEVVEFADAPNKIVIIYNEFDNTEQTELEIYV